jgi:hypothetical protein
MSAHPRKSLQWFRALTEVPGVVWTQPAGVAVDLRLSDARPIPDEHGFSPLGVTWVDNAETPIADDYRSYMSPAELVLQGRWQENDPDRDVHGVQRDPTEVVHTACQAVALPGTRFDYHQALRWLSNAEGVLGSLVEQALKADIELVLSDPADAVVSPWSLMTGTDSDLLLSQASDPILRLMSLYVAEGFLIEASATEELLERLPDAARPRQQYWRRPGEIASALAGLRT